MRGKTVFPQHDNRADLGHSTPGVPPVVSKADLLTGKPKPHSCVASPIHNGMTSNQKAVAGMGGRGHAVESGGQPVKSYSASSDYDAPQVPREPFPLSWGMRHRDHTDSLAGGNPGEAMAKAHDERHQKAADLHAWGREVLGASRISGSTVLPNKPREK